MRNCTLGLRTSLAPTPTRSSTIPPRVAEFLPIFVEASGGVFEAHRAETLHNGGLVRLREIREVDERVAFARDAFVEFHYGLCHGRSLPAHLQQRRGGLLQAVQVIEAERVIDSRLREQLPASRLRPKGEMARVSAVKRNAKTQGEVSFEVSRVVADEMGAVFVCDGCFDLLQQERTLEDFEAERARRIIIRREQGEAAQGMARNDAREQIEVILDHAGMNRLRSDVDHARPRLGEEQEEEKKTLFVGLDLQAGDGHVDRHRWHDNDRLFVLIEGFDRAPERHEFLLERIKLRGRILCGNAGG